MSYPLTKESPFKEPLKIFLDKMIQSGAINRIWKKYEVVPDEQQCIIPKVGYLFYLLYYNYFFHFLGVS